MKSCFCTKTQMATQRQTTPRRQQKHTEILSWYDVLLCCLSMQDFFLEVQIEFNFAKTSSVNCFAVSGMIGKSAVHPETYYCMHNIPDSKVHGTNIGLTWVMSAPDGPHVGPMKLAIRNTIYYILYYTCPLFVRKSQSPTCSQILWREARSTMLIKMIFIGCYRDQIYTTTHLLLWVWWKN